MQPGENSSILNRDFVEILSAFNAERVEYLLIGGYALAAHGLPRATGDIDLWVNPAPQNAAKVWRALGRFGAPLDRLSVGDFSNTETFVQFGVAPSRIDILTSIPGLAFAEAYAARITPILDGLPVSTLSRDDLVASKRAAGRPQDLADVARIEAQARGGPS